MSHRLMLIVLAIRTRVGSAAAAPMMRRRAAGAGAVLAAVLGVAPAADAQVIPVSYQMTRTAPGHPANTFTFTRAAMQCGLPRAEMTEAGLRINDPANDALDCELRAAGNWSDLLPGLAYTFALRGCNEAGQCGPATTLTTGLPGAPAFRLRPGVTGVAASGTVRERYPFAGLDVARVWLDAGGDVYLGAQRLSTPGYDVRPGDRVDLLLSRGPQP
jgi:hypothetical protein